MNLRLIAFLIAFVTLPVQVLAADRAATAALAERAALLQTLGRGSNISSNNQQYQILPGVRTAQSLSHEEPQQAISRMGGGKLIETKGSFVVFTAAPQSAASVTLVNGATSYPAALNPRTGGIGIVPGTLNVKLKDMASAAAIATGHGLELVSVFPHLRTAFYRAKPGQDVVAAAAALAADSRVASAEVEVIENVAVPQ